MAVGFIRQLRVLITVRVFRRKVEQEGLEKIVHHFKPMMS